MSQSSRKSIYTRSSYIFSLGVFVVLLIVFYTHPNSAFSQEISGDDKSLKLEVSPLVTNLSAKPGTTISTKIKLKNGNSKTENIRIGLMKFGAYGEKGSPRLEERGSSDAYLDWMNFSEDSFTLYPEESKIITATINVPNEASFGYYYAVTFSRSSGVESMKTQKTALVGSIASLILLEADVPNAKREVELVDFEVDQRIHEFLPVSFDIRIKNTGNVHVIPAGNVFIEGGNDGAEDLDILPINPASGNVLPSTSRVFTVKWTDGFPINSDKVKDGKVVYDKNNKVMTQLAWDTKKVDKFRFGRYHANLLLTYDDGTRDQVIESQLSFWIIPWRIFSVAAILILLMLAGVYSIIRPIISPHKSS